jgi:DNA-binding NtrC family response regulator
LPPLRERKEDIPDLIHYYVKKTCQQMNRPVIEVSGAAMKALCNYEWPGNVRELINVVENSVVFTEGDLILPDTLFAYFNPSGMPQQLTGNLRLHENEIIIRTLEKNGWNISKTAKELGICRNTLYNKIKNRTV